MMPTRWPSYILILLTAVLGMLIPILLPQIWRLGRKNKGNLTDNADRQESATPLSPPIAIRFHLAALLFVGFLGLALLMIPLLFGVRTENGNLSAVILVGISVATLIALFYGLRKGDLSWSAPKSKDEGSL